MVRTLAVFASAPASSSADMAARSGVSTSSCRMIAFVMVASGSLLNSSSSNSVDVPLIVASLKFNSNSAATKARTAAGVSSSGLNDTMAGAASSEAEEAT